MLDLRLPTMLQSNETRDDSLALEYVSIVSVATYRPNI
jgi:hypothetical protein